MAIYVPVNVKVVNRWEIDIDDNFFEDLKNFFDTLEVHLSKTNIVTVTELMNCFQLINEINCDLECDELSYDMKEKVKLATYVFSKIDGEFTINLIDDNTGTFIEIKEYEL